MSSSSSALWVSLEVEGTLRSDLLLFSGKRGSMFYSFRLYSTDSTFPRYLSMKEVDIIFDSFGDWACDYWTEWLWMLRLDDDWLRAGLLDLVISKMAFIKLISRSFLTSVDYFKFYDSFFKSVSRFFTISEFSMDKIINHTYIITIQITSSHFGHCFAGSHLGIMLFHYWAYFLC